MAKARKPGGSTSGEPAARNGRTTIRGPAKAGAAGRAADTLTSKLLGTDELSVCPSILSKLPNTHCGRRPGIDLQRDTDPPRM